jgi:hypothetical protein
MEPQRPSTPTKMRSSSPQRRERLRERSGRQAANCWVKGHAIHTFADMCGHTATAQIPLPSEDEIGEDFVAEEIELGGQCEIIERHGDGLGLAFPTLYEFSLLGGPDEILFGPLGFRCGGL